MYILKIKVVTKNNLRYTLETFELDETEIPFESPAYFEFVDNCILYYNRTFESYTKDKELFFLPEEHRLLNPSNVNDVFHYCSLAKKKKKKSAKQSAKAEISEEKEPKFLEPFAGNDINYSQEHFPSDYKPKISFDFD